MTDFIDLFCGAGGLSLGLEAAGLRCAAAVEINRDACDTFVSSHANAQLHNVPIESLDFKRYRDIPLLVGGPPCQPFSAGGKGLAAGDARDMLPQFMRAVREAKPSVFLMENVPGLAGPTHRTYLGHILGELASLGYCVTPELVNAAEYGVPQKRKRLIVIGVRNGQRDFRFPSQTHGPRGVKTYATARSALGRVKIVELNESVVTYAKRPDLRPSPYDGHLFNGGGRAIDLDAPSHTILASAGGNKTHFVDSTGEVPRYHRHLVRGGQPRNGVLEGGRRLTVEESAALQTFPKGMRFCGSRSSQYCQIGNAVPPRLAQVLGKSLATYLKDL